MSKAIIVLVLASSLVYLNILPNPFIWSEEAVIVENPTFKDLGYLPKFFTVNYWLHEHPFSGIDIFRPMREATFTLEYALWGLNPLPYHVFNIILHAATTLLIFFLFKKITRSFPTAFLTSLFFAVHPIHTETVTWTMSRDDIMCTLFPLISWWFFIKRLENPARKRLYLSLESFFFILGLLSREMAMVFPLLLCLYVICFYPKDKWKGYLLATLPYWLIDFAYTFFHFYFWWDNLKAGRLGISLPLFNHALLVAKTIGFYLKLLVLPINLSADHYFPLFVSLKEAETRLGVGIFLLFLILAIVFYRKSLKQLAFSLAFTILAFLPVANIIIVTGRPIGEQRVYLPSIGFCFFLALIFQKILQKYHRLLLPFLSLLLVSFYSYGTIQRNYQWRSPRALWESAVRLSPATVRAHRNLAGVYLASNEEDKAIQEFETIVTLEETERAEAGGIKEIIFEKGQPLGALVAPIMPVTDEREICEMREKMEKEAKIRMVSTSASIHQYLGDAYRRRGDLKRAAYEYNVAIIYDPASFESYNGLGIIYDMAGFDVAAISTLEKGLKIKPDSYPLHHNLAIAYEHAEKYDEAISEYEKVIEAAPDYDQPHLRLAIIYGKYRIDRTKAGFHWQKYLELTRHPDEQWVEEMKELLI